MKADLLQSMKPVSPSSDYRYRKRPRDPLAARSARLISFLGHALVWFMVVLFISIVATPFVGLIVALAWGIGLASHGFFGVVAPLLKERWTKPPATPSPTSLAASSGRPDGSRARSLEELSAAIAHEIRNPITAAKSLVQQIYEDPQAAESREHAQVAIEELDRVERSIAHLLRYAREVPFEPRTIDVRQLVDSAVDLVQDRANREQVQLRREFDELPSWYADGEQLRTVIANLISNALDAHREQPNRDAHVQISAGQNLAGSELWIRVRDNGPGISNEAIARIFQPFYTTKQRGTGLGLALARKVVERHGGTLEASSKLGQGAEFLLVLPRNGSES